ncbi:hypothetical protein DBR40_25965 [Pedobacter sp. KBW01]|uniref:helix-turn-helix domain-containing protein n=1 Tax=Pedobacter sp. KBW01 TaxID=2153364 RepID=UPI000F595B18|nr:helix-turn-helix transcriptional regulator [Pedobacter sp. KBW01]RQO64233.1 hypothetical protein DBR40_25965 [Pedobacter sp. KBW01]
MLFLNVIPIFIARGIERPHTYLTIAGFTPHPAHYILHGKTRSIRLDHIEKLCKLLICEPADLFVWYLNKNEILSDKHPLKKLIRREEETNIHNLIADVPFKDIAKIAAAIKEQKDDQETKKEA